VATEAEIRNLAQHVGVPWEIIRGYSNEHSGCLPSSVEQLDEWGSYSGRRRPDGSWVAKHRATEHNDFDYANLAPWPAPAASSCPGAAAPWGGGDATSCVRSSDGWPLNDCPAGGVFPYTGTAPAAGGAPPAAPAPAGGGAAAPAANPLAAVTDVVRANPVPALVVAAVVGYLLVGR